MPHETHCICNKRLRDKSQEMKCCYCFPHIGCEFEEEGNKIDESDALYIATCLCGKHKLSDIDQAMQDDYFGQQCIKNWIDESVKYLKEAGNNEGIIIYLLAERKRCDKRQDNIKKLISQNE